MLQLTPDNENGFFDIVLEDFARSEQRYLTNTAVLETKLFDLHGNVLKIIDFAPRFECNGRTHCPTQFVRMLFNEVGVPRICVKIHPVCNYGKTICKRTFGSNHISYFSNDFNARCTTNLSIDYIEKEIFFNLNNKNVIFFGNDEEFKSNVMDVANHFYNSTCKYWLDFTKSLHLPLEWQKEVIRSAITLKLCQVESSGAIVAAMTTSIPESENSERNWDYRFCWLRDSYFIIQALNRLGATCTMENYLNFISNIVPKHKNEILQPLYSILTEKDLTENLCPTLKGYRSQGPVRIGNQAYLQKQNDNYGNIILSVFLIFYDERFVHDDHISIFRRLEKLGEKAFAVWNIKDAGIWELRNSNHVHTISSAMCWAACDRLARISKKLKIEDRYDYWSEKSNFIKNEILEKAWDEEKQCFVGTLRFDEAETDERHLDASVLLFATLKLIDPKDERFIKTVHKIEKELVHNDFCFRYISEDDFGFPENSFVICTFWFIEALAFIGETKKARRLFKRLLECRNHVGLLAEDINSNTKELWGNFPQAYSMVGIINTAIALSKSWDTVGF